MPSGPRPNPPTRVCKLTYSGHFGGAPWVNVMWLFLTGSGEITTSELNTLADHCSSIYATRLMVWLSIDSELEATQVVLYSSGDSFEGVSNDLHTGGHTGSAFLPANIAACITWGIAPVYRGGHPRTYLAGISQDQIASVNSFSAGFLTALRTAADLFHSDLEAITGVSSGISSVEHGVVSFVRDKAWRTPPVFYRINSSTMDNRIDSQRRRLGADVP